MFIGFINMVPYLKIIGIIPTATMGLLRSVETGQTYGSVLLGIAIVFISIQVVEADSCVLSNIVNLSHGN